MSSSALRNVSRTQRSLKIHFVLQYIRSVFRHLSAFISQKMSYFIITTNLQKVT